MSSIPRIECDNSSSVMQLTRSGNLFSVLGALLASPPGLQAVKVRNDTQVDYPENSQADWPLMPADVISFAVC